MRLLVSAIPHDRWPYVVRELVRVTRPGGWVESVEAMLPVNGGPIAEQLMDWIRAISQRRGVEIADAMAVGGLLHAAGAVDVSTRLVEIPCGDYGGRVGKMMAADYFSGVKAVGGVIAAQGVGNAGTVRPDTRPGNARYRLTALPLHLPRVYCLWPSRPLAGSTPASSAREHRSSRDMK